jgi:hypothetical protein
MKRQVPIVATALALALTTSPAWPAFTAVGVYDEQTNQTNSVNAVAVANSGDEAKVIEGSEFAAYKTTLATAFTAGTGGVVNFDALETVSDGNPFSVTFAGGSKSLSITPNIAGVAVSGNQTAFLPLSAAGNTVTNNASTGLPGGMLVGSSAATSASFDIGAVTGGDPLEAVISFGITMLSRNSRDFGTVTAVATFSDASTATATAVIGAPGKGNGDTFFGFVAPTGTSLTKVSLTWSTNANLPGFDDLAFTTAIIPEPGSLVLIAAGGLTMLWRRRR